MGYKKTLLLIAVLLSLLPGAFLNTVQAQSENLSLAFKNVTLWIYPEYDDPRLLVMLEGQISRASPPQQVRFLVPTAAEMYSAGSMDAQGQYSGGPPNRKASAIPGWDEISYELKTDTFRVEYYDPVITTDLNKQIAYDFRWLYPISDLKVVVQVPKRASNYTVTPAGKQTTEGAFTVYTYNYTNPDSEQPLHFDIAYTKSDANPSQANSTSVQNTAEPWGFIPTMIIVGVLLVVGASVVFFKLKGKNRRNLKVTAAGKRGCNGYRKPNKNSFCGQCGHPLRIPARFCPQCGNKLGSQ